MPNNDQVKRHEQMVAEAEAAGQLLDLWTPAHFRSFANYVCGYAPQLVEAWHKANVGELPDRKEPRCAAAHAEDVQPCEGPPDAVRLVDGSGVEQTGCVRHAAVVLASVDGVRVYPGPAGVEGAAIEAFKRAQRRRPWDFVSDDEGGDTRA